MKKVNIDVSKLKEFDVELNCLFYEDVWDDVFGAEDWTEDGCESVGFIDHDAAHSYFCENTITFEPFTGDDTNKEQLLYRMAKNIHRALGFCLARVMRGCEDPGDLCHFCDEEWSVYEDESGIIFGILVSSEHEAINILFYCK